MMCDNDKDTFCSHAGTLCRFLVVQEPSPLERGGVHYLRHESIFQKLHLSDPVSNGKKVLDWLEGKGGGLVREPVQQGLLQGQVGRVQRLEDVRLQTVARVTLLLSDFILWLPYCGEFVGIRSTILVMCLTGRLNQ